MKNPIFLFCVFLFIGFNSFGQEPVLTTFYDYKKCLTGLVNEEGDTVQSPQFKTAQPFVISEHREAAYGWLVQKEGKQGVLAPNGDFLIPCKYDQIRFITDSIFQTIENGKRGIVDLKLNLEIEPIYSGANYNRDQGHYLLHKDFKMGVLSRDHSFKLETIYDEIEILFHEIHFEGKMDSLAYFRVKLNGSVGLLHNDGSVFVPIEYKSLSSYWLQTQCQTNHRFFSVRNQKDQVGFLNASGETIVPLEYTSGRLSMELDSDCKEVKKLVAVMQNEEGYCAIDVLQNARTPTFQYLRMYGDRYLYANSKGAGILSSSFQELVKVEDGMLANDIRELSIIKQEIKTGKEKYRNFQSRGETDSSFIFHWKSNPNRKPSRKMHLKTMRSLINVRTGKKTNFHNYVSRVKIGEDTVYWGVDYSTHNIKGNMFANTAPLDLTIYDADFKVVFAEKNVKCRNRYLYSQTPELTETDSALVFLELDNLEVGAISPKGEVVIPFEYDSYKMFYTPATRFSRRADYIIVANEKEGAIFDIHGQEVWSRRYEKIVYSGGQLTAFSGDTIFYFRSDLKLITTHVSDPNAEELAEEEIKEQPYEEALGYSRPNREDSKKEKKTEYVAFGYFVENEYLYHRSYDTVISRVDSNFTKIFTPVQRVNGRYIITLNGEVLYNDENDILLLHNSGYFIQSNAKLRYFNYKHEELMNVRKGRRGRLNEEIVRIYSNSGEGIYNTNRNEWVLKPEYLRVFMIRNDDQTVKGYWGSIPNETLRGKMKKGNPEWKIFDPNGKAFFDNSLASNRLTFVDEMAVIQSRGRFGLVNSDFELLLPIEQDYIVNKGTAFFIYNNGKWKISVNGKVSKDAYDDLTYQPFEKGFAVFKDGELSILDYNLETVLPFVTKEEAMKIELADLLGFSQYDYNTNLGVQSNIQVSELDQLILNYTIWRMLTTASTKDLFFEKREFNKKQNTKRWPMYSMYSHFERELNSRIVYRDSMYVCEILTTNIKPIYAKYRGPGFIRSYSIFYLENGEVKEMALRDFIVPGKEDELDALIIEELNRIQAYGSQCVDLPGEVGDLKLRAVLGEIGLELHEVSSSIAFIVIPYYLLEGILDLSQEGN